MTAAICIDAKRARIPVIDMARGVAILAMIVYHFTWDLGFLGFIALDVNAHPGWIAFQRMIVSSFLFLVGAGLVLGHGRGLDRRGFLRRLAMVAGAALLVSLGTYLAFPESFVYFGILHAIALFSLLALPFLGVPLVLVLLVAGAVLAAPLVVEIPAFASKPLSWIGLWDVPPLTEDLVPVFPFFGIVLLGMAAMRIVLAAGWERGLAAVPSGSPPARALVAAGRWSLVIYLLHQPILLGILVPLAMAVEPGDARRPANYLGSCEASCAATGGDAAYCTAYCACTLERVEADDLWTLLEEGARTPEEQETVTGLANQCSVEAIERLIEDGAFPE